MVDGEALLLLTEDDIRQMIPQIGLRSKFRSARAELKVNV